MMGQLTGQGPFAFPQTGADDGAWVEPMARDFAKLDRDAAERTLDALIAAALSGWHLREATAWQRVRLRSLRLRSRPPA